MVVVVCERLGENWRRLRMRWFGAVLGGEVRGRGLV